MNQGTNLMEIKYLKLNDNANTTHQNLWDAINWYLEDINSYEGKY